MKLVNITESSMIDVAENSNWYAWLNQMPPPPNDFHVVGDVVVPNPGVKAFLLPKVPQGINPTILFLDLILVQQLGNWPQLITVIEARYDKIVKGSPYTSTVIFSGNDAIAEVPVDIVS